MIDSTTTLQQNSPLQRRTSSSAILLADVNLLEMIATLIPGLSRRVVGILIGLIEVILEGGEDDCEFLCDIGRYPWRGPPIHSSG